MKKLIERCVLLMINEENYHCYYKGYDYMIQKNTVLAK